MTPDPRRRSCRRFPFLSILLGGGGRRGGSCVPVVDPVNLLEQVAPVRRLACGQSLRAHGEGVEEIVRIRPAPSALSERVCENRLGYAVLAMRVEIRRHLG